MKNVTWMVAAAAVGMTGWVLGGEAAVKTEKAEPAAEPVVYPTAIFAFAETGSGVAGYGVKVSEILFANLATKPDLFLVDRSELKKLMEEHELNLSGMVNPGQATKVGQLTGAKVIVTGSVVEADKTLYLVAKIIGTETSRVSGESVKGNTTDERMGARVHPAGRAPLEACEI